jgi:hypothetical protein
MILWQPLDVILFFFVNLVISGSSSPLHSSNVNGHHKPSVEHALSSLTSEMVSFTVKID